MVEYLTANRRRIGAAAIVAVAMGIACVSAFAQMDPMRPPDAPAVSGSSNVETSVLKSILISDRRTEAVIGDRVVQVGGTVGHARVEKITASEVVLRDEHGLRTLKLFPGIERHVIGADATQGGGTKRNSGEKHRK